MEAGCCKGYVWYVQFLSLNQCWPSWCFRHPVRTVRNDFTMHSVLWLPTHPPTTMLPHPPSPCTTQRSSGLEKCDSFVRVRNVFRTIIVWCVMCDTCHEVIRDVWYMAWSDTWCVMIVVCQYFVIVSSISRQNFTATKCVISTYSYLMVITSRYALQHEICQYI